MTDPRHVWFSVAASPPPVGVVVLVIWDGRAAFEAARVVDPRARTGLMHRAEGASSTRRGHPKAPATCWLTHDKGRAVLLPTDMDPPDPRRPWAGWHTLHGDAPDYWRPAHPEKWQLPLPAPAYIQTPSEPGRMWSSTDRPRRSAELASGRTAIDQVARVGIDGMTAAELARAMEDMREEARAQGADASSASEAPEQQWWLDPHAVTYSAPGAITMREAEGRLMRAFAAEWWVRVEWPRLKTAAQVLANMAKTLPPGEAAAQDPIFARPEPTGRDQDDMLEALGWLRILPRVTWKTVGTVHLGRAGVTKVKQNVGAVGNPLNRGAEVLRLRASTPPLTWRRIGDEIGRPAEAARDLYRAALAEVTAAANGTATAEVEAVRAKRQAERVRLDALKANKKQAKTAAHDAARMEG